MGKSKLWRRNWAYEAEHDILQCYLRKRKIIKPNYARKSSKHEVTEMDKVLFWSMESLTPNSIRNIKYNNNTDTMDMDRETKIKVLAGTLFFLSKNRSYKRRRDYK